MFKLIRVGCTVHLFQLITVESFKFVRATIQENIAFCQFFMSLEPMGCLSITLLSMVGSRVLFYEKLIKSLLQVVPTKSTKIAQSCRISGFFGVFSRVTKFAKIGKIFNICGAVIFCDTKSFL